MKIPPQNLEAETSLLGALLLDKEAVIKTFLTQIKYPPKVPEKGKSIFCAVLLTINPKTAKAESIKQIITKINIT